MGLLSCVAFESLAAQTEQNEGVGVEIHPQQTNRVAIDFSSRRAVARATAARRSALACAALLRRIGAATHVCVCVRGGGGVARPARVVRLVRGWRAQRERRSGARRAGAEVGAVACREGTAARHDCRADALAVRA